MYVLYELQYHRPAIVIPSADDSRVKKRREILQWLCTDDMESTHERHYKKRLPTTGQWLLDTQEFRSWRDAVTSGLLWCHGTRKYLQQHYINCAILICIVHMYSRRRKNNSSVRTLFCLPIKVPYILNSPC